MKISEDVYEIDRPIVLISDGGGPPDPADCPEYVDGGATPMQHLVWSDGRWLLFGIHIDRKLFVQVHHEPDLP
jgi:hypothetical protein